MTTLITQRLILRQWRESDLEPFAVMNADSRVMTYFPALHTKEESLKQAHDFTNSIDMLGWGFWAVEEKATGNFIGMIGLNKVQFSAPFTPAIEIGWRLCHDAWGKGYATEGAQETLRFAFEDLDLKEVVAFTVPENKASRRVMEKLGMTHNPTDDFEHLRLSEGHPMRRHVLYRISKKERLQHKNA